MFYLILYFKFKSSLKISFFYEMHSTEAHQQPKKSTTLLHQVKQKM